MAIKKIISGGQTCADQTGLDVAIKNGIPRGGAIPKGRMTENGTLPEVQPHRSEYKILPKTY